MKTTCLINNFNYESYVIEAVNSALRQSVPFDEIIVVDDGSTDSSPQLLEEKFTNNPKVKLILSQKNSGQLSSLNQGYLASNGDVIFFLDSDDIYEENYLGEALKVYASDKKCSFLFCETRKFGDSKEDFTNNQLKPHENKVVYNLGYSIVSILYASDARVGISTSGVSIKKEVLDQFMPIPFTNDWRISADRCLSWGSSLVGAKKYYLTNPLIKYRVHDHNNYFNNPCFQEYEHSYLRELRKKRLFNFITSKMQYDDQLQELAAREFRTIPKPTFYRLRVYLKIVLKRKEINFLRKTKMISTMVKHYFY